MRALLLLLLVGCSGANSATDASVGGGGGSSATGGGGGGGVDAGPDLHQAFLDAQNQVRTSATPAPSPALPALTWNMAAEQVATAWAQGCTWEHNANRGDYGENIYASTNEPTPAGIVSDWASEASHYSYATNLCVGTCGHYTQLVWRDTTSVGCAITHCTTGSPFGGGDWYFAVCDYAPPGNYVGEKPY